MKCLVCGNEEMKRLNSSLCSCTKCKVVYNDSLPTTRYICSYGYMSEYNTIYVDAVDEKTAMYKAVHEFSDMYSGVTESQITCIKESDIRVIL